MGRPPGSKGKKNNPKDRMAVKKTPQDALFVSEGPPPEAIFSDDGSLSKGLPSPPLTRERALKKELKKDKPEKQHKLRAEERLGLSEEDLKASDGLFELKTELQRIQETKALGVPPKFNLVDPSIKHNRVVVERSAPPVQAMVPADELIIAPPRRQEMMIEDSLSQPMESDNNIKTVSKELFNKGGIDLKTEVSHDEIIHITKLRFLEQKFGIYNIDNMVESFLGLRVSKDRKSRAEFIDALQTENRNRGGGGLMGRLFGQNSGGNQGQR